MDYIGEDVLSGQIGHFLVILSFVASIIATISYFMSARVVDPVDAESWKKMGRIAFFIDVISVLGIFIILYNLIANHRYEYQYVFKNSGNDLEPKYILSAVWSASEGSFILWALWHAILGGVLIFTAKKWEAPVMTVLSFAQVCLATMMLGIYFFGNKVGASPFALFREQMPQAPIFQNSGYLQLEQFQDGNGLNMLLQNYWMVIHPPVLFLGFASTIIPFCFAMGGLLTKKYGDWVKPALPWALFSACVLGVGIMMGGAWAYESLSFGGYWAWDPVENASLVPWLTLIAGIHTLLIYKHTGRSLQTSFFLISLTFILILYSTFLTRSGILGDTSVHSFADLGMNTQLFLFLYVFVWLPTILSFTNSKARLIGFAVAAGLVLLSYFQVPVLILDLFNVSAEKTREIAEIIGRSFPLIGSIAAIIWLLVNLNKLIPSIKKEEATSSREFWMFIGSLVILISAIAITIQTSVPVYNKVFNQSIAPPQDIEFSYNRIQIFIAIIIGLLTAIGQYLKYKETGQQYFVKRIGLPFLISAAAAGLILYFGDINYDKYGIGYLSFVWTAIACAVFAIIANLAYIWIGIKGNLRLSGPSVAHFGFAMMLLGILISSSKKEILSHNKNGIFVPIEENKITGKAGENYTLPKGVKMDMGKYWVTYSGDSSHPKKSQKYFNIHFTDKETKEDFTLKPNAFINYKGNEGLSANPDARHYWNYDVFAYITALADPSKNQDTTSFTTKTMKIGDSIFLSKKLIILDTIETHDSLPEELFGKEGKFYEATLKIYGIDAQGRSEVEFSEPKLAIAKGKPLSIPDTTIRGNLITRLDSFDGTSAVLGTKEPTTIQDFLTLKVYKFPFINLLWLGTLLMALGFIISMVRRIQLARN